MTKRQEIPKYLTPNTPQNELERFKRSFCIPNDAEWLGVFMGAIYPLTQAENWKQHGSVTPQEAADVFLSIFNEAFYDTGECDEMSCCATRYGSNGRIQQQDPVTGEWTDIESPPLPARTPVEGQDTQCLAAANAVEVYYQTWLAFAQMWEQGYTVVLLATAIISMLAVIIFYPPALPLVITFFYEMYLLMAEITADDFDSDKREEFKCILYCASTIEGDTVTFDFDAVLAEVDERWNAPLDINIWTAVHYLLLITGSDGLDRAGATTSISTATCECVQCSEEICWIPSGGGSLVQAGCTGVIEYLAFDVNGAYTTTVYPNYQAAYVDLAAVLPLSGGATGWQVKATWSGGAINLYGTGTGVNNASPFCVNEYEPLTPTSGIWQRVEGDNPIWLMSWQSSPLHINELCIKLDE